MVKVLDILFNRSSPGKVIYDAAMSAVNQLTQNIRMNTEEGEKEIKIESQVWFTVIPGDPSSPKVMGLDGNKSLIYYPKFSTPYSHHLVDKCKFVTILSGCIYDEVSGKKFSSEHIQDGNPFRLKIRPTDNFRPYTKACECFVLVQIDDCENLLSQICS